MALFGSGNDLTTLELRSPLDNPAVPISSPAMWEYLTDGNPTASGERINEANALQITTVYSCVTLLASQAGSLPLRLIEKTDKGHTEAINNLLHYLLSVEPNPEMSSVTYIETLVGCLVQTGNCYSQLERNALGQVVALWPLHPLKTTPVRLPNKKLAFKTSDGEPNGSYRIVAAEDIIHVPLYCMDGLKGISPIEMARQSLGLAKAAELFGARTFGNSTRGGDIIFNKGPKPDLKTQKEMRDSWQEQNGGANSGKTKFLWGGDWSYQKLGMTPEESQFLGTRGYQRADIAALYKISPHLVGDTSRLSGTNSEQLMLQLLTISLRPLLGKLEAEFNRKLCPTQGRKANKFFTQFDVSALLRTDLKSQNEAYQAGRIGGWFTANDVLRKLGENPAGPECDVYWAPVNYQNAKRMLDTESLQDQPIDQAPPTPAERNMLGVYTRTYLTLYSNSFKSLSTRKKRDYDCINTLFRPVLRSIADVAISENRVDLFTGGDPADDIITDALKSMEKRVAKWPEAIPDDQMAIYASAEFTRAVRAIHIGVSRDIAAAKAVAQLQAPDEDSEDDQAA